MVKNVVFAEKLITIMIHREVLATLGVLAIIFHNCPTVSNSQLLCKRIDIHAKFLSITWQEGPVVFP